MTLTEAELETIRAARHQLSILTFVTDASRSAVHGLSAILDRSAEDDEPDYSDPIEVYKYFDRRARVELKRLGPELSTSPHQCVPTLMQYAATQLLAEALAEVLDNAQEVGLSDTTLDLMASIRGTS